MRSHPKAQINLLQRQRHPQRDQITEGTFLPLHVSTRAGKANPRFRGDDDGKNDLPYFNAAQASWMSVHAFFSTSSDVA